MKMMKYKIELSIDPEKWTPQLFSQLQTAAIRIKKTLIEKNSKRIADELLKKLKESK